jgi:hypothetical protein
VGDKAKEGGSEASGSGSRAGDASSAVEDGDGSKGRDREASSTSFARTAGNELEKVEAEGQIQPPQRPDELIRVQDKVKE